ncbi:unnamed protein product [Caenorhabditis angaria]|uniref:Sdz-33 F-box domain-containing protein n=1 Tax=Caenorhabditis angaria TaxID=860376 RepID=A0A9P1IIA5_9PELO|nr:unnamed protein product [Caenorhabditis angaria]
MNIIKLECIMKTKQKLKREKKVIMIMMNIWKNFPLRRCSFFDNDSDSEEEDSSSDENENGKQKEKEEKILDEEEKRHKELMKRRGEIPLTRAYVRGELAKQSRRAQFSLFESAKFTPYEGYYPEVAWNYFRTFLEKRQKSVGVIEIKNVIKMFDINKIKVRKFDRLERLDICESYMFKFFLERIPDKIKNVKLSGGLTGIIQNLSGIVDSYPKILNVTDSLSIRCVNISYDGFLRLNARKIKVPIDEIKYEDVNNFIKLWIDGKISKTKFDMCRFNKHSEIKMDQILKDLEYVEIGNHVKRERYNHFSMKKRQMYRIVHKIDPNYFIDVLKFENILILCVNSDVNDGYENKKHLCNVNFCCQKSYKELLNNKGPMWW